MSGSSLNESFCSTEGLVSKANDRESYRLWFEFLKRACSDPAITVNTDAYKSWGEYQSLNFDAWWRSTGEQITSLVEQTYVERVQKIPKNSHDIFVRIPVSLSTTQALRQLKVLLTSIDHRLTSIEAPLKIRTGAEIRHASFRSYLVSYDAYQMLRARSETRRVSGSDLLREVRLQYEKRQVQYLGGVSTGQKIDPMPSPLYGFSGVSSDVDPITDKQAIASVLRYLKKANETISNVAAGRFPD